MSKRQKPRPKQVPAQQPKEEEYEKMEKEEEFSLYDLLQVDKTATKDEMKKQYRKLVFQYHPDKNRDDPLACQKFQKLKEAFDILSDDEKRQQYDATGRVGDEFNQQTFQNAYDYYRKMFKPISPQDIKDFQKQYKKSKMEEEDLLQFYEQHQGDMGGLLQSVPLSTHADLPRFMAFLQENIALKTITKYKAFSLTKDKVRSLPNEEKEVDQELKKKEFDSLVLAIQSKKAHNVDFLDSLEQKYGMGKKRKIDKKKEQKPQKSKK